MKKLLDKMNSNKLKIPAFWILLIMLIIGGIYKIDRSIPDSLYIDEDEAAAYRLINQKPWVTSTDSIEVSAGESYTVTCKLWNIFPLKTVTITQAEAKEVAISGKHVGIYMKMEGILVIDTEELTTINGEFVCPVKNLIKEGDYIKSINNKDLTDKKQLVSIMEESKGDEVEIGIVRDGYPQQVRVTPVCVADGTYKLGIWVRDNAQGIGTVTYVADDGRYGSLGHGVSDPDTGGVIGIRSGDLYTSEILSIQKGRFGNPGELQGVINYGEAEHLGTIEKNTACGIFGTIDENRLTDIQTERYPIAFKQDMYAGPATVVCTTDTGIQEYGIEIEQIYWSPDIVNKSFTIHVTDEALLKKTGGIIQGLSGSPIIQDGKLVGAVTHVLVNDPTRGYGIFIENMLDASE